LGFLSSPAPGVRYAQTSGNGKSVDIEGFSERVFALSGQIASGNLNIRQLQGRVPRSSVFTASKSVPLFFGAQQSTFPEDGSKTFPTDTELGRDLLGSLTGKVGLDRVLKVDVRRFSGHVYNLQTESGWYSSNGIITHNCWAMHGTTHPLTERLDDHPNGRCVMLPKVKAVKGLSPQWLPESGEAQFKRLDPATQANILGPLYELYETGQIGLADVVGRKFDGDWGSMRFVRSKKSITEGMG
jgi:hypothetical protein